MKGKQLFSSLPLFFWLFVDFITSESLSDFAVPFSIEI